MVARLGFSIFLSFAAVLAADSVYADGTCVQYKDPNATIPICQIYKSHDPYRGVDVCKTGDGRVTSCPVTFGSTGGTNGLTNPFGSSSNATSSSSDDAALSSNVQYQTAKNALIECQNKVAAEKNAYDLEFSKGASASSAILSSHYKTITNLNSCTTQQQIVDKYKSQADAEKQLVGDVGSETNCIISAQRIAKSKGMELSDDEAVKKYGCDHYDQAMTRTDIISQGLTLASGMQGQIQGNIATTKTAQSYGAGGDAFKSGAENMGDASIKSGRTKMLEGVARAYNAWTLSKIKKENQTAANDLKNDATSSTVTINGQIISVGQMSLKQLNSNITNYSQYSGITCPASGPGNDPDAAGACTLQALTKARDSKVEYQRRKDIADASGKKAAAEVLSAGQSLVTGVGLTQYGKQMKNQADQMGAQNIQNPTTMLPNAINPVDVQAPTMNGVPQAYTGESSAATAETKSPGADGPGQKFDIPGGLASGQPNDGGLKDGPLPPNNALEATGGPMGGVPSGSMGGGGGGGAPGGGAQAPADDGSDNGPKGGIAKFESNQGGGTQFGVGGSGGNKARVNETGEMSLKSLMEQMLGKNDDAAKDPKKDILSFNGEKGPGEGRTLASADDGSILGPNSNLFLRVAGAMQSQFKKGNIK